MGDIDAIVSPKIKISPLKISDGVMVINLATSSGSRTEYGTWHGGVRPCDEHAVEGNACELVQVCTSANHILLGNYENDSLSNTKAGWCICRSPSKTRTNSISKSFLNKETDNFTLL